MKKVMLIIGTRPEAIKMAPVFKSLHNSPGISARLVSTGQHRQLSRQALASFAILPDIDLDVMTPGQSLSQLTSRILTGLEDLFAHERPDLILGHGDTTTAYAAAVASFYHRIPFFHVEAGLRSHLMHSPFPEEFNRQSIAKIASHHFAPSESARGNLLADGIHDSKISVTGNTIVDAIEDVISSHPIKSLREISGFERFQGRDLGRLALITLHRRESSASLPSTLEKIARAARENQDCASIFPLHPSPVVRQLASESLSRLENLALIEPLSYADFLSVLMRASLVLTDSGGVQEEASYFGKKVFILRDVSERTDGVSERLTEIVGSDPADLPRLIADTLDLDPVIAPVRRLRRDSPARKIASIVMRRWTA